MKTKLIGMALVGLMATGCSNAPEGDSATISDKQDVGASEGKQYNVNSDESKIRFIGYGVGKNHPGTFKIVSGKIVVENNEITGGEFMIDIQSLYIEEAGDMFQNKLKPHLLSADFFDAENYGTAKFEITGTSPYERSNSDSSIVAGANLNISGNLTLKNETKNVTFPAMVNFSEKGVESDADFNIDRSQWKMVYGNDKSLGDKFISERVNIELHLKASL
jgi:polyisoprenoid-binding protein YceI